MPLIEVIKHDQPDEHEFVWKYPSEDLKLGAQVIVNESQEALFVKSGEALDLLQPGTHTLNTGNIPLLNKIINLPFGGDTPFTAEIWYINKTVKRDLKWGTPSPVPIMDLALGFPVSLRAFGKWGVRISDSRRFLTQIVGTQYGADSIKIRDFFIGEIVEKMGSTISQKMVETGVSILQISAEISNLSEIIQQKISEEFARFGIEVINFNIESINIPDDEMKKIQDVFAKKMEVQELSKVQAGGAYGAAKSFEVMNTAAENPGDGSGIGAMLGAGIGIGAGIPIGQQMGQQMGQKMQIDNSASAQNNPTERLKQLKSLFDEGLISEKDYNEKKTQILGDL